MQSVAHSLSFSLGKAPKSTSSPCMEQTRSPLEAMSPLQTIWKPERHRLLLETRVIFWVKHKHLMQIYPACLLQLDQPDKNQRYLLAATWWAKAELTCLPTLACLCMAHIFLSLFRYLRTSPCLASAFLSVWGWCHSGYVLAKDPLKITGANNDDSAS